LSSVKSFSNCYGSYGRANIQKHGWKNLAFPLKSANLSVDPFRCVEPWVSVVGKALWGNQRVRTRLDDSSFKYADLFAKNACITEQSLLSFHLRIAQRITSIGGWGLPQLGGWKPPPRESLK
jgi:hypothetical protein